MSRPLRHLPTGTVWARVHARRAQVGAAAPSPDEDVLIDVTDYAMGLAWGALNAAGQGLAWVRCQLMEAFRLLTWASTEAFKAGWETLGWAIEELSQRVGEAFANLGRGLGAALEGFLGFKPVHGLALGGLVGLALVGGVVVLATTPGGQAALPALVKLL